MTQSLESSKLQEQLAKEMQLENEEKKKKRKLPKPGFIVLFRDSSSYYHFTYITSLSLEQKIANIKLKQGDGIQIVHTLETSHTLKFYHHFIKDQFSNRLVSGETNVYALTNVEVALITEEKFPSNVMEWLVG